MAAVEFIAIGNESPQLERRTQQLAKRYKFQYEYFESLDEMVTKYTTSSEASVCMVLCDETKDLLRIGGQIQVARQANQSAFVIAIIHQKLQQEGSEILKENGADIVFLTSEVYYSSKVEFIISQKVRSLYIPIKTSEILLDSAPPFRIFTIMPMNKKYLAIIQPGQEITEKKYDKMRELGELYIRREDVDLFRQYVKEIYTAGQLSESASCRAQYVTLSVTFVDLVINILDQNITRSFDEGKALYQKTISLAEDLLQELADSVHPWDIINNSSEGDFGSVERSPAVCAYAGLMSKKAKIGNPIEVMTAALLSDIGMLELSPETTEILKQGKYEQIDDETLKEYHYHPIKSLNAALGARLPIPEKVKTIVLNTHERVDGAGFPKQRQGSEIPIEAQLIQLCELIDNETLIRMGEQRRPWVSISRAIFQSEYSTADRFSQLLLELARPFLNPKTQRKVEI